MNLLWRHKRLNEHFAEAGVLLAFGPLQQALDLLFQFLLPANFFDEQWHLDYVELIIKLLDLV